MRSEIELRLSELQHRLLGNFQLLHALIGIRLRSVSDPESRRHLNWLNDVIVALGLLNRRLAEGGILDFGGYLAEATGFWKRMCEGREIGFLLSADAIEADDQLGSSLALMVHELIANAVEHAFPEDRRGQVAVSLRQGEGTIVLTVTDNGVGIQHERLNAREGLGLVHGLAEHVGGRVETLAGPGIVGTTVTVRIPRRPRRQIAH